MKLTAENLRVTLGVMVNGAKTTDNLEDVRQYRAGVRAIRLLIDGEKGSDRFGPMIAAALQSIAGRLEHLYGQIENGPEYKEPEPVMVILDNSQFEEIAGGEK